MADNVTFGGVSYQRVILSYGGSNCALDVNSSNPLPVAIMSGGGSSSGGLTNTELRASPVPVSGTFYPATQTISGSVSVSNFPATQAVSGTVGISGSVAVTGPLTDAQMRAAPIPVSGTFWQTTQPVSIASTVNVSGPLTDAQLRAAAVPVSGTFWQATQPVSIASMPTTPVTGTFWQATQPVSIAATVATRDAKDTTRSIVNAATAIAGVTAVTTEALLSLNVSRDGANTAAVTSISVTSGKKLRILGVSAGVISTAAAVISARVALRLNPSGTVTATSPVLAILPMSQQAAALAQAGDTCVLMFSEAIEISGNMQVGLSQVASAATGTVWASLIAYEY